MKWTLTFTRFCRVIQTLGRPYFIQNPVTIESTLYPDIRTLIEDSKQKLIPPRTVSSKTSDVLTTADEYNQNLLRFQLTSRKRIMWEFQNHFSSRCDSVIGGLRPGVDTTPITTLERVSSVIQTESLEEQAFTFASQLSDMIGVGVLSLCELEAYLNLPANESSLAAIDNMHVLLAGPAIPEKPMPPPAPEQTSWVFQWLKNDVFPNEERAIQSYGDTLIREGFSSKEDFKIANAEFSKEELLKIGIEKIGHQMKFKSAHKKLLQSWG